MSASSALLAAEIALAVVRSPAAKKFVRNSRRRRTVYRKHIKPILRSTKYGRRAYSSRVYKRGRRAFKRTKTARRFARSSYLKYA